MKNNRILLKNGCVVDPLHPDVFTGDVKLDGNVIEAVDDSIKASCGDDILDVSGKLVMPGLVDMHVHVSHCPEAYYMLARAGVTSALDMAGTPAEMIDGLARRGTGLTVGFVYPLIPGETVSGNNPAIAEISQVIDDALENGAFGVKILGGHFPLTAAATRNVIEIAARKQCWVAVHAGTVETAGNITGFEELAQIVGDYPVHLAHINSYCRGSGGTSPLDEAKRALEALRTLPNCCSESYLADINGASGKLGSDNLPKSEVTKRCLLKGGYSADFKGMKKAILDGWAKVHFVDRKQHDVIFPPPPEAWEHYIASKTNTFLSFSVNSPLATIPLAIAKDAQGEFIVDALATDGGAIPRNVTLRKGLCLVEFGALTLNELALKAALTPARLLGLNNKGRLSPGSDADIVVVDPVTSAVELVISGGRIIVENGTVRGQGGCFFTSERGKKFFKAKSAPYYQ